MSLLPSGLTTIPEETARLARTICPKGTLYMHIRDHLGVIYGDESFAALFSTAASPLKPASRLTLVCIFQFIEGLTDRQAAEAVEPRIDWKYALRLELRIPALTLCAMSRGYLSPIQSAHETQKRFLRSTNLPDIERWNGKIACW